MERIGGDITRELEYEPAKLEAHIHVRPKYACRRCKDGVCAAPLPTRPIPGGIAGPGLVTVLGGTGYDAIFLGTGSSVIEVACWSHARRKFFDAVKSNPREAHQVLEWIRQLYDIEDRAHDWSVDARRELRVGQSNPVLDKIEAYLTELAPRTLPKSSLSKAVTYARNQWEALRRYTEDGRLTIDNNVSERTLRQQAIGRKNWLFLGSEAAGPRAAVLYTILAGAKRHRIEPWAYVRDVLLRLHADDPRLEEMLPDPWAAAHPFAIPSTRSAYRRARAPLATAPWPIRRYHGQAGRLR